MRTIWPRIKNLKQHTPFLLVLLLHLALALIYSSLVPLGEAPDESAHLGYARFIAQHNRLPATLAERQAADYRADFPPLYYLIIARPLAAIGDTPPTHLKSYGDTPRRLIATNGQTSAASIHTADEAWPWQGITLGWHLGRFVSVLFSMLALIPTYLIALRLTNRQRIAICAAALQAFIPQVLFVGSVLNEDSLLILLAGLILLTLINYVKPPRLPGLWHTFLLGLLMGLASVSKYNAIPLWPLVGLWGVWLTYQKLAEQTGSLLTKLKRFVQHLIVFTGGVILTSGWWFGFVWYNFNEIDSQGLLRGSLAAFTSSTHDTTLRQVAAGASFTLPPLSAWLDWLVTLFKSFWGLFGGGGSIDLPAWSYWLLAVFCILALISHLIYYASRFRGRIPNFPLPFPYTLFLLTPLFFLPLPILRFIMTGGNIAESAQGRHLFPALSAITLALIWGLSTFNFPKYLSRITLPYLEIILPAFTLFLSLYALPLIHANYPPPIPLRTTAEAATVENLIKAKLTEGVTLVGYEVGPANESILPLALVWQAEEIPPEDYLINLTLLDDNGRLLGNWLGHPIGGRYPTRAWDKHDILRDTIPIPLLPNISAAEATLTLQLLDTQLRPVSDPIELAKGVAISSQSSPMLPSQLRADGLAPEEPFTYRSTISFVLPEVTRSPDLITPEGQIYPPVQFIVGPNGSVAHFMVEAYWPSGNYQLFPGSASPTIPIKNRPRQFQPPPMQNTLNANFADHITLLGYDLPERRVEPGDSFPLTLHLRANRTMGENLVIFNHLLDSTATQHGGADRIPQQYYTTLLWVPGEIVSDNYQVPVDADAPPGIYRLDVGLYPDDNPTLSLPLVVDGHPIDRNSVQIGPIKVGGPPSGITVANANPQHPVNKTFSNQITLLGFSLTDTDGNPSPPAPHPSQLTLFWQAETIPIADYTVFVHLLDADGNLAAQFDSPPAEGAYPTSLWDSGEIIVDNRHLNNLPPDHYTVNIGLYQPDTGARLPIAGADENSLNLIEFEITP